MPSNQKILRNAPYIEAKYFGVGRPAPINLIVIHSAETNEGIGTARAIANYFKFHCTVPSSAHYNVDNREVIQSVWERNRAWAAPPCNTNGIHIEMAGRAGQTASQWKDDYSISMMKLTARLVAELVQAYDNIPVRQLSTANVRKGWGGITGHVNVSQAFRQSNHTDPGVNFPWTFFMQEVRNNVALATR